MSTRPRYSLAELLLGVRIPDDPQHSPKSSERFQFTLKTLLAVVALCAVALALFGWRAPVVLSAKDAPHLWKFTGKRVCVHGTIGFNGKGSPVLMVDGGGPISVEGLDRWGAPWGTRVIATGTLADYGGYGTGLTLRRASIRAE